MAILYKDDTVTIDESGIIIPKYYFPTLKPRRIPWSELRSARMKPMSWLAGKWRVWGMSIQPYWFNWDMSRLFKSHFIALDTGTFIKPAVTPDHPEVALAAINRCLHSAPDLHPLGRTTVND